MEDKIYQVLRKHRLPLKKREELMPDLLALFSVSVSTFPTEDEIIETILGCVEIRGVELEHHKREFTDDRSGLITALNKLYSR